MNPKKIEQLLRAAMQAPSGGNQQPWKFIVVTNKEILNALGKASPYSSPAGRAPLCIVILGNTNYMRFPKLWTHDLSACCQNILLEAEYLGLGAVWMSIEPTESRIEYTRKLLSLPGNIKPFALIALGYPNEKAQSTERFDTNRVHYNTYQA